MSKNKLEELKGRTPFSVPDGYFEGFTDELMNRLPEKTQEKPNVVSLYERVKPLLYLAAVFAGLLTFFYVLDKTAGSSSVEKNMLVQTSSPTADSDTDSESQEDADFLEYIEEMYADKYVNYYIDDIVNY